jgi:hypothetical protein
MPDQGILGETLDRLLAPAEPEVGGDSCFDEFDRCVDLELASEAAS